MVYQAIIEPPKSRLFDSGLNWVVAIINLYSYTWQVARGQLSLGEVVKGLLVSGRGCQGLTCLWGRLLSAYLSLGKVAKGLLVSGGGCQGVTCLWRWLSRGYLSLEEVVKGLLVSEAL